MQGVRSEWGEHLWVVDDSGCWVWQGRLNSGGYAMFAANTRVGRKVLADKLGRPLRRGEVTRHTCDRPECVNPDHLIPGAQANNVTDAVERGRKRILHEGDLCAHGHALTGHNIIHRHDSSGDRIRCRTCMYTRIAAFRARSG